jgi:hypothetical protein
MSENPALTADVEGVIAGDTIRLILPHVADVSALVPHFAVLDARTAVRVNGSLQTSDASAVDFTHDVTYTLESSSGDVRRYIVRVIVFTGLPVVTVTTAGGAPILNREDYVSATVTVYGGQSRPEHNFSAATQIRGRGNSTWSQPKKPYRLKLGTSASLFGFPADRDWTLLANYWDPALGRNAAAFELSRLFGAAYTPRCTPVELVLNGAHQGSYQLCEHMEVAANRIPATSAGWLLEMDDLPRVDPGDEYFRTPRLDAWSMESDSNPTVWVFKSHGPPSPAQRAAIEADVLGCENTIFSEGFADPITGYASCLDVDALVTWYLLNEVSKNNDAAFFKSVYAYKTPTGKITFGPIWDFDLAFGNYPFDGGPTGWKIRHSPWIERLFEDRAFVDRVKARWAVLYALRSTMDDYLSGYGRQLALSAERSHTMWAPYQPRPLLRTDALPSAAQMLLLQGTAEVAGVVDHAAEVTALRSWLSNRYAWLNAQILDL